jgi:hypothetical protein
MAAATAKSALEEPTQLRERLALATCGSLAEQDIAADQLAQLQVRAENLARANQQKRLRIDELMTVRCAYTVCACPALDRGLLLAGLYGTPAASPGGGKEGRPGHSLVSHSRWDHQDEHPRTLAPPGLFLLVCWLVTRM